MMVRLVCIIVCSAVFGCNAEGNDDSGSAAADGGDSSGPHCRDEAGKAVDWWVLYKLPRHHHGRRRGRGGSIVDDGLGYVFISSDAAADTGWVPSTRSIGSNASMPGLTLAHLYDESQDDVATVLYNDEKPDGETSLTQGHTKGVVIFGRTTGFWLVHSVPKFPPPRHDAEGQPGVYGYPASGEMYGQSFLCFTMTTSSAASAIGEQLSYNRPFLYGVRLPDWAANGYPVFAAAARGFHIRRPPYFSVTSLTSLAGVSFVSFAKDTNFNKDLYADLVAPSLQSALLVETWPNGHGRLNSSCKPPYHVENIARLDFSSLRPAVSFKTTHDHAKWAVTSPHAPPPLQAATTQPQLVSKTVVCIGDINRMTTQLKRAGGTVCFASKSVWSAFVSIVGGIDGCPRPLNENRRRDSDLRWPTIEIT